MKYFNNPKTLEELKQQYKKLAMQHHPDKGGSTEIMQSINNEYDKLFQLLKNVHSNVKGETYTTREETTETSEQFKDIINKIIHFEGCQIEIIGSWLWVSGATYSYKDILKELKFNWCNNKKAWSFHTDGYKKRSKKQYTLEGIREMWGSETVATERQLQLA